MTAGLWIALGLITFIALVVLGVVLSLWLWLWSDQDETQEWVETDEGYGYRVAQRKHH